MRSRKLLIFFADLIAIFTGFDEKNIETLIFFTTNTYRIPVKSTKKISAI